jgi:hypothetical protein
VPEHVQENLLENPPKDTIRPAEHDSVEYKLAQQDSLANVVSMIQAKEDYRKTTELREKYIGFVYEVPVSLDFIESYGWPETLIGTDLILWVAYFPVGDLTAVVDKRSSIFKNISSGRYPRLKHDVTLKISEFIGKRLKRDDFASRIGLTAFGPSTPLQGDSCGSAYCVEYYPKGNFTTLTYHENSSGVETITLKRIAIGKVHQLRDA